MAYTPVGWSHFIILAKGSQPLHTDIWTANKCTKFYNARAQLLFCALNLLFGYVLVAAAVLVCLIKLSIYVFNAENIT